MRSGMSWSLGNKEALSSYFLISRTLEPGLLWLSVLGAMAPFLCIPPDTPHAQAENHLPWDYFEEARLSSPAPVATLSPAAVLSFSS